MKINTAPTSLQSYAKNVDGFESRELQAMEILGKFGNMTSNELFSYIKTTFPENYRHNTHARLAGLRDKGLVFEAGKKNCTITDEMVIVWGLVPVEQRDMYRRRALEKKLKSAKLLVSKIEKALTEFDGVA